MRALVTGGGGFIGSNLVDALVERGDEVTVVDDLSTGKRDNLDVALGADANLVELDIRDAPALAEQFERVAPEVVFHLAAQIDVRRSVADPALDSRVNVEGTINVLNAARAAGVKRVVNTSTGGAIYGEGQVIPAPEDHPVAPGGPLRPVEVLRRALLRAVHARCTGSRPCRCATATSTGRVRTRSARPA